MTRTRIAPVLACLALATLPLPARAADPAGWMAMDEVVLVLKDAGYAEVREVEVGRGVWRGKAAHDGHQVAFEADPRTGTVLRTSALAAR